MIADIILLLAGAALIYALALAITRLPLFPLQAITLSQAPARLTTAQVEDAARRAVNGNFLTTDIERTREVFEQLPGVRQASVRRVWPGSIEVELEEHQAAARWWVPDNTPSRMLNTHGELFPAEHDRALPLFIGPDEHAPTMLQRFIAWTGTLSPLQRRIDKLTLSRREAWQLLLDDGTRIELGRDDDKAPIAARLARYVSTQPAVSREGAHTIIYADLRYPNGYAIRTRSSATQERP
jgi:cell division protein FtsQ